VTVATSAAQRRAFDDGSLPQPERIRDNVWALATPMPGGVMGMRYTLTYLLRSTDGHVHVVDPGWDSDDNAALLAAALNRVGGPLGSIIVTHLHPDHLRWRHGCGSSGEHRS
jgi:glyoxylase-like metal-dependent hydrolase (beta-lactamase superfamily II)